MSLATFEAAVAAAVEACLPSATRDVTAINWADNAREFSSPRLLLSYISDTEEHVREGTVHDGELSAMNQITVQVLAEGQHADPDIGSRQLLEIVRLGLRRKSIQDALFDAGVVLVGLPMSAQNVSYNHSGRRVNAWAIDVAFRTIFVLAADPSDDFGLIQHVTFSGEVTHGDDEVAVPETTVDDTELEP